MSYNEAGFVCTLNCSYKIELPLKADATSFKVSYIMSALFPNLPQTKFAHGLSHKILHLKTVFALPVQERHHKIPFESPLSQSKSSL